MRHVFFLTVSRRRFPHFPPPHAKPLSLTCFLQMPVNHVSFLCLVVHTSFIMGNPTARRAACGPTTSRGSRRRAIEEEGRAGRKRPRDRVIALTRESLGITLWVTYHSDARAAVDEPGSREGRERRVARRFAGELDRTARSSPGAGRIGEGQLPNHEALSVLSKLREPHTLHNSETATTTRRDNN